MTWLEGKAELEDVEDHERNRLTSLLLNTRSGRDVEASTSRIGEIVMEEQSNAEPKPSTPKEANSKGKGTKRKEWANLFQRNRAAENGMTLTYKHNSLKVKLLFSWKRKRQNEKQRNENVRILLMLLGKALHTM